MHDGLKHAVPSTRPLLNANRTWEAGLEAASNKGHSVRWQPCRLGPPCTVPSQGMHVFSATGLVPVSQIRLRLLCPLHPLLREQGQHS